MYETWCNTCLTEAKKKGKTDEEPNDDAKLGSDEASNAAGNTTEENTDDAEAMEMKRKFERDDSKGLHFCIRCKPYR